MSQLKKLWVVTIDAGFGKERLLVEAENGAAAGAVALQSRTGLNTLSLEVNEVRRLEEVTVK